MWQRFTERARRVILHGQQEAEASQSSAVDREHLLLGLLLEKESMAVKVLRHMGVSLEEAERETRKKIATLEKISYVQPKLTPAAKRVLERAAKEARKMCHIDIGTEHLLLALLHGRNNGARDILKIGADEARAATLICLGSNENAARRPSNALPAPEKPRTFWEKLARRRRGIVASTREADTESEKRAPDENS